MAAPPVRKAHSFAKNANEWGTRQFPAGTSFTPYTFLRNVADTPVTLTATLWWMESGAAHSAQLPSIALQAYETRDMAVPALLGQYGPKNFNGSFNLVFEGEARRGSLVMSSGSVDQTNTYVFEVGPRGIGEGTSKSLQYWSTGNGDDTMVSVWNPADEAQDFAFTLYFKGGHYIFPIHLEGRETRALDISTIIQNQVPDVEGNIIPASVHDGTAKIAGSKAETEVILVAVQAGIYNVRKATCHSICAGCDGYTGAFIDISSFTVTVGGTQQLHLVGIYGSGGQTYIPASWNSTDTNVATVGTGTGLVTGVGPGSVSIMVDSGPNQPIYVSWGCDKPETFTCPTARFQTSASGTVKPTLTSISPAQGLVGAAVSVTINGTGFSPGSTIQAGPSITVSNISVSSSTTMTATFTIQNSPDASGNWNVTVTASGQTSNGKSFFVRAPTTLGVLSVSTISNGVAHGGCKAGEFGIHIDVRYQVLDQNVTAIQSGAMVMIPQESIDGGGYGDIGPNVVMATEFTDADGTYHDAPVGICAAGAFNSTVNQAVRIAISGSFYSVRTNSFTISSSSAGHGSISNGSDISKTR